MRPRTFVVGLLALVCGVSAAVGVNRMRQSRVPAKPETVVVPVAAVAIKRGDKITDAMLVEREWPKTLVPSGALIKKDKIVGKIASAPLVKGEPIFAGKIGDTPRFSGLIKDGMRAYAILTPNDSTLVAGLVEPGDKVDVLYTDEGEKELTGGGTTTVLMQHIEVLAIGQIIDGSESRDKNEKNSKMRSVTLSVTPDQANRLDLAQKTGTLGLALRSDRDEAMANVSAVTAKELRANVYPALFNQDADAANVVSVTANKPVEPKMPSQIAVRTLRGAMRSTIVMRASTASGSVYSDGRGEELSQ